MKNKPRRMKKYAPRRKTHTEELQKQQLGDFEHLLNLDLGSLLVLNEEGTGKQIEQARQKLRSDLLKYGSDMKKLAGDMGEDYSETVDEFITSASTILSAVENVDPSTVKDHHKITEFLEKMVKKRIERGFGGSDQESGQE